MNLGSQKEDLIQFGLVREGNLASYSGTRSHPLAGTWAWYEVRRTVISRDYRPNAQPQETTSGHSLLQWNSEEHANILYQSSLRMRRNNRQLPVVHNIVTVISAPLPDV